MRKNLIVLIATSLVIAACSNNDDYNLETVLGESKQVFDGQVTNWIKIENNMPLEIGITIDEAVLSTLPETGEEENEFVLNISQKAKQLTTIDHIALGWNPNGHSPQGIYDLPHFDFHYYMVSEEEVEATVDFEKMDIAPSADYLPVGFIAGPSIPMMGKHWLDSASPELNGAVFTQTFTYGSNDGKVTFYEPMITKTFLMNATSFERGIPLPSKVTRTGNYPTRLKIEKRNGKVSVILRRFIKRQVS